VDGRSQPAIGNSKEKRVSVETIPVPDVGSDDAVDVIEVSVQVGDTIEPEDTIVVLESDKATLEVPAPKGGSVTKLLVQQGDQVREGDGLLELDSADEQTAEQPPESGQAGEASAEATKETETREQAESAGAETSPEAAEPEQGSAQAVQVESVPVPDLGDIDSAELVEFSVGVGDEVDAEQIIAVLESDKASLEIPAPAAGTITRLVAQVGAQLASGDILVEMETAAAVAAPQQSEAESVPDDATETPPASESPSPESAPASAGAAPPASGPAAQGETPPARDTEPSKEVHAGPAVRKLARKLGVDLGRIGRGSGPHGRILKEDVHAHVKTLLTEEKPAGGAGGAGVELPEIDFSQWGEVEHVERSKLRKVSAANLHRSWVTIPHVTQHDQADVTELEAFRKEQNKSLEKEGVKLTMLAFLVHACARTLRAFPDVNASLSPDGETLIRKHYIHMGIAVDTANGLVVPVLRDADQKGLVEIARELDELSGKARDGKLSPRDMQGGTFSISSLGGIGGTAFTPVVNWPEAAILGVSRMATQPVWDGQAFQPRLMLPLSFSYDHRIVDGADAARFTTYLAGLLKDMRRALL
jgi:pyruvate dehydrogenase E2 component (dihydrolipoamide acetyltransferase)